MKSKLNRKKEKQIKKMNQQIMGMDIKYGPPSFTNREISIANIRSGSKGYGVCYGLKNH